VPGPDEEVRDLARELNGRRIDGGGGLEHGEGGEGFAVDVPVSKCQVIVLLFWFWEA
jgi:hypothetical protein